MASPLCSTVLAVAFLGGAVAQEDAARPTLGEAAAFKILYAGSPDGSREEAFVSFLSEHFAEVKTMDLRELDAAAAAPFDVVVADWRSMYGNDGYSEERVSIGNVLGADFTKPVVAVSSVVDRLAPRGKLDWL